MFKVFGDAEQTPGTPVTIGKNPKNGEDVKLHLRIMPSSVMRQIEKRHGRETQEKNALGQLVCSYERNVDETYAFLHERAAWLWVDTTNFVIEMGDDKSAEFFRDTLKDEAIKKGEEVKLDGRLNGRIKAFLFQRNQDLALRIVREEAKLKEAVAKEEKGLSGN
jgi:hypothetical protein